MPKICKVTQCNNPVFGGGYCKYHQYHRKKDVESNPRGQVERRELVDRKYFILRKEFLEKKQRCVINAPGCTTDATEVHHTRGRGIYLLMTDTWLPSCKHCNRYVESNDQWARDNGYKKSRLYNDRT